MNVDTWESRVPEADTNMPHGKGCMKSVNWLEEPASGNVRTQEIDVDAVPGVMKVSLDQSGSMPFSMAAMEGIATRVHSPW